QTVNDFQPNAPRGGMLAYGDFALDVSSYSRRSGRRTLGYRYRESILPLDRNALVVGTASDHTHTLVIQKPLKSRQKFIVSLKNDEVLTANAKQSAKNAFYGMVACGILGVIFLIIGLLR
ncbi:MAG: E3 ubiquitin ligase, partial [Merismopedia sp. SIO2A8]|nr:E3 ubiquitin ligase [Merismopedia sp. SIO2A8]